MDNKAPARYDGPNHPALDDMIDFYGLDLEHAAEIARCLCGHTLTAHEHYRRGSDCGICGCPEARPA